MPDVVNAMAEGEIGPLGNNELPVQAGAVVVARPGWEPIFTLLLPVPREIKGWTVGAMVDGVIEEPMSGGMGPGAAVDELGVGSAGVVPNPMAGSRLAPPPPSPPGTVIRERASKKLVALVRAMS